MSTDPFSDVRWTVTVLSVPRLARLLIVTANAFEESPINHVPAARIHAPTLKYDLIDNESAVLVVDVADCDSVNAVECWA